MTLRIEGNLMNSTTRTSLQTYQTILYKSALHPELFQLRGRRVVKHGEYELEGWLLQGAHVFRFEHKTICCSELVTDQENGLPSNSVVTAFLCAGDRDYEHRFERSGVTFMHSVQTETLSENLYDATFREMQDFAKESNALTYEWDTEFGRNLSIIDTQRYGKEIHCQAYHLQANGGVVLRTQTLFEHA
jgi:hypothetical protein